MAKLCLAVISEVVHFMLFLVKGRNLNTLRVLCYLLVAWFMPRFLSARLTSHRAEQHYRCYSSADQGSTRAEHVSPDPVTTHEKRPTL